MNQLIATGTQSTVVAIENEPAPTLTVEPQGGVFTSETVTFEAPG